MREGGRNRGILRYIKKPMDTRTLEHEANLDCIHKC